MELLASFGITAIVLVVGWVIISFITFISDVEMLKLEVKSLTRVVTRIEQDNLNNAMKKARGKNG